MSQIEFDPSKDAENRRKHGLSLADAEEMDWVTALIVHDERRDYREPRFQAYGTFRGRLHVAVFTPRNGRLRIISYRRANRKEIGRYG
jgi:uncharacterized DUF497 family protein